MLSFLSTLTKPWRHLQRLSLLLLALAAIHHVLPSQGWQQWLALGEKFPLRVAAPILLAALVTFGVVTVWDCWKQQSAANSRHSGLGLLRAVLLQNVQRSLQPVSHGAHLASSFVQTWAQGEKRIYIGALLALALGEVCLAPYVFAVPLAAEPLMGAFFLVLALSLFTLRATWLAQGQTNTNIGQQLLKQLVGSEHHALLRQLLLYIPAGLALYWPLVHFAGMAASDFIALYIVAHMAGVASRLPGGAGVFEGVFLFLAARHYPAVSVFVSLIAYRSLYYLLPLVSSVVGLVVVEFHRNKSVKFTPWRSVYQTPFKLFQPLMSSLLLWLGLYLAGLLPQAWGAAWFAPLPTAWPLFEVNLVGLAVLIIWRCHFRRIDLGFYGTGVVMLLTTLWLLWQGHFLKACVGVLLLSLFTSEKPCFFRRSAVLQGLISRAHFGWHMFGVFLLAGSLFFLEYTNNLIHLPLLQWLFAPDLAPWERVLLVFGLGGGAVAIYPLFMRCDLPWALPTAIELEDAKQLAVTADQSQAHLALCGDKHLCWSENKRAFLMFGKTPRIWVVMGDPIGDAAEFKPLIVHLMALADQAGTRLAFYKVSQTHLALYANLGLAAFKLGEEACVDLNSFTLAGAKKLNIRNAYNRNQKEGLIFDVLPARDVPGVMQELKAISDDWLAKKLAKEKQFSLGAFDADYLAKCDVAVVRFEGRIVAFANLWCLHNKQEIALDLMRYSQFAPKRVMEFLMVSLILWGKGQGYSLCNLGMAPLAGLEAHTAAPWLHQLGHALYHYENRFYNFPGIYSYKDKFSPSGAQGI